MWRRGVCAVGHRQWCGLLPQLRGVGGAAVREALRAAKVEASRWTAQKWLNSHHWVDTIFGSQYAHLTNVTRFVVQTVAADEGLSEEELRALT